MTAGNANVIWREAHICRVSAAGASLGSVGSAAPDATLDAADVYGVRVSGAEVTATDPTDRIYVVLVLENTDGGNPQAFTFLPSQTILTPLVSSLVVRLGRNGRRSARPMPAALEIEGLCPDVVTELEIEMPIGVLALFCDTTLMTVQNPLGRVGHGLS